MKILLTFVLFTSCLFANLKFTKEELLYLENNPIVKIGLTNDKPFTFNEDGEIKGMTKDILDEISKLTNLKFHIKSNTWIDNFQDFKKNEIDIMSDLFYKSEREDFTFYSKPYIKLPLIIFSNKQYPNFNGFQSFKKIKVGLIKGSKVIKSLENYSNIEIVIFDNQNDQISALSFGKIDFALQTLHTANVYIRKNFFSNIFPIQSYEDTKYYESLHFGINKNKPILHSIIDKALTNINLKYIEEKWFNTKMKVSKISLTKKEKEFLLSHPIIILGTEKSWEPYVIQNNDGSISGYDADILNEINNLSGANFQLKLGSWRNMQKLAKEKKIDGLSTGAVHEERKKYLNFSDTYISLQKMVIVKHRNPLKIKSKKDLEGKTIVIHKGNLVDEKIAKEFSKSKIIKADSFDDMLKEVIYGEADATFGNGATEYIANKLGLPYLDFAFALDHRLELSFGVRKDWPEAISIINKSLNKISEYEKLRLKEKWFILSEYEKKLNPLKKKVILNVDEKLYTKENPIVKICIDPNWYPFEFLNKENKHDGLIAELFNQVSLSVGLKTKLIQTNSWNESLEFIKNKKCDLLASAQKTQKREEYLNFTSSYVSSPLVIATRSKVQFIDDFSKVSNMKFAIVKAYASIDILKDKYPNINILEVENIHQGLKKVINNEIFGFIDTVPSITNAIKTKGYFNLSINGKIDLDWKLGIATRKDLPILNSIYDKGIQSLSNEEKKRIYNKWIDIALFKEADYTIYWKVLTGLILIVILILFWNRQLRIKVNNAIEKFKEQESLIFYYSKQKSMGELVGNISHQWRHPLGELSGNIMNLETKQKLNKEINQNDISKHINDSKKVINFMSDTIETFYDFYKNKNQTTVFNLKDVIEESLLILKGSFELDNIQVVKNLEEKLYLNGNPNELKQVILAIMVNSKAIFKKRNIQQPKIEIKLLKVNEEFIIEILDNGGGIEEHLKNKIFNLNFSKNESSGIGLYISKKIVEEKFGGNIEVQNRDSGACFRVSLTFDKFNNL